MRCPRSHFQVRRKERLMDSISLCIAIFLSLISTCRGNDDRIVPGKPLSPGSTVVSEGGVFALGFFSPINSSTRLYVGIWYNNIPNHTVVWVANRNSPITNQSSALLSLTNLSELVVSDSLGTTLWKTDNNTTRDAGAAAVLLDTGNLVVQLRDGTIVWQSFDHPTDTILLTMNIWLLRGDNIAIEPFISWKGPDDPSTGDFSLGGNSKAHLQLSSISNGPLVTGQYPRNLSFVLYVALLRAKNGTYLTFTTSDSSRGLHGVLANCGNLQIRSWDTSRSPWAVRYSLPNRGCDQG